MPTSLHLKVVEFVVFNMGTPRSSICRTIAKYVLDAQQKSNQYSSITYLDCGFTAHHDDPFLRQPILFKSLPAMSQSNIAVLTKSHNIIAAKKRARKEQVKEVVFDETARRYAQLSTAGAEC